MAQPVGVALPKLGEMGELVGDTVGLEIGDVEAGAVNGPLFDITNDNFGVVIIVGFVCEKKKSCKEKGWRAKAQK